MDFNTAENFIINKQSLGIKPGLSRIEKLLRKMGNPQESLKIIHIAGTNGKGSVAAMIANALQKNGFKTGLFTSPWVTEYREQIQINGEFIPKSDFAEYVAAYKDADATEFELLTAIMYKYFADKSVDYAVVECGMGGLEDSTNAFSHPELAVITCVAMDHMNFLGKTLPEIAVQKAGIIKNNSVCVLYPNPKCEDVFENRCTETGSRLIKIADYGDFKLNNLKTAESALDFLNVKIAPALPKLPARTEMLASNVMVDGAHNENGANALEKSLPHKNITAVVGMMADKDYDSYLRIIAPHCKKIIATTPSNSRALPAERLAEAARKYCGDVCAVSNPEKALQLARKDLEFLLVCGSFYLARDLRKYLL